MSATAYQERFGHRPAFPTAIHQAAAEAVVDYWATDPRVQAVLLLNSCARGCAVPSSCLDMAILVAPDDHTAMQQDAWPAFERFLATDPASTALTAAVPWGAVEADLISSVYQPSEHGFTSGPDAYELEVGNHIAWSHPLLRSGPRWNELQRQYLPYYDELRRQTRLRQILWFARNNIEHIGPYARRELLFAAHKRLLLATEEYLQALFISRCIYPIAYDKWIRQQLVDVLAEPELYDHLVHLSTLESLSVAGLEERADLLTHLLAQLGEPQPCSAR
jgi:hypothetical protein